MRNTTIYILACCTLFASFVLAGCETSSNSAQEPKEARVAFDSLVEALVMRDSAGIDALLCPEVDRIFLQGITSESQEDFKRSMEKTTFNPDKSLPNEIVYSTPFKSSSSDDIEWVHWKVQDHKEGWCVLVDIDVTSPASGQKFIDEELRLRLEKGDTK